MRFGTGTLQVFIADRRRVWIFCARCGRAYRYDPRTESLAERAGSAPDTEGARA